MREIIDQLPYSQPFLFVDELFHVDNNSVKGCFTFKADLDFYKGHFKSYPVTPGVILTECMAQIGLACLGLYLAKQESKNADHYQFAMTSTDIEFFKPVYPGEKVTVISEKQYFRFNKLKCNVEMINSENNVVCKGILAGMIVNIYK